VLQLRQKCHRNLRKEESQCKTGVQFKTIELARLSPCGEVGNKQQSILCFTWLSLISEPTRSELCNENFFGTFTQNDTTPELTSREGQNKTRLGLNLCNWPYLLAHFCSFKSSLRKGNNALLPHNQTVPLMLQAFQSGISIHFNIHFIALRPLQQGGAQSHQECR